MNFKRPLNKGGNSHSPIEKCGIILKGKGVYDPLFFRSEVGVFYGVNVDFKLVMSDGSAL